MFDTLLQTLGLSAFSLKGFGPLLLEGTWMTVKLSILSLLLSVLLGLIGASAKLSSLKILRIPAQLYTTLIRGVPDLVLMLLIFYSLQTWLTSFTVAMDWEYIEINPFGQVATQIAIEKLAARSGLSGDLTMRSSGDGAFMTDGGHLILDASFGRIPDADALASRLNQIPGVVEHGLFINLASLAIIAGPAGARVMEPKN